MGVPMSEAVVRDRIAAAQPPWVKGKSEIIPWAEEVIPTVVRTANLLRRIGANNTVGAAGVLGDV